MLSTSQRLSFFAFALYLASAVAAGGQEKPYAPELMPRSPIVSPLAEREVVASRPVLESAFARSEEDPIQIKRSTSWSDLSLLGLRSEDAVHARGLLIEPLEARSSKTCSKKNPCKSTYFCSQSSKKCTIKKNDGLRCNGNNAACKSDYCSVKTNLCRAQTGKGSKCLSDDGCKGSLSCVNKVCKTVGGGHTTPTSPTKPSPSGSAKNKRELEFIE